MKIAVSLAALTFAVLASTEFSRHDLHTRKHGNNQHDDDVHGGRS